MTVTINAADTTATLTVPTTDDSTVEADGTITATVTTGTGYTVDGTDDSASVMVEDNDVASAVTVTLNAGIAGNDIVNIAERAAGFDITGTVEAPGHGERDPWQQQHRPPRHRDRHHLGGGHTGQ